MIIIGSTALKYHFPEDCPREPNDIDVVVKDSSKFRKIKNTEFLENPALLKYEKSGYISPVMLLTLKMSHLFWDINWDKHMFDVQFLLKKGCKYDLAVLREFREYWEQTLPKVRRSNLELNKEEFFSNKVNKDTEEHDKLHKIIAEVPAYTKILKDGAEVELDENKWIQLSFKEKCDIVREEAYVMAAERYKNLHYIPAYRKQLKDCIQKHYPEYIALFAIENYKELEKPECDYKQKIENGN